MNLLVNLVTMSFPHATELVCLAMAIQGSLTVRSNKSPMHWFHAFVKSTLTAYAGATFTNIFMGRPTAMFANDIFFGACVLGFLVVNYTPYQLGYRLVRSPPGMVVVTVFSQIFRVGGIIGFSDAAFAAFRDSPSVYYPMPIFGPILCPTLLGNMGGFFFGGLDGYLEKGMPWLFQQGLSCSTFYHFYAHDTQGVIGITLRQYMQPFATRFMGAMGASEEEKDDPVLFAKVAVGLFMVTVAILRMPMALGEKFHPFDGVYQVIVWPFQKKSKKVDVKPPKRGKKKMQ